MIRLPDDGILYHGSYIEVSQIDLSKCKYGLDFGKGFYVTSSLQQARSYVPASVRKAKRRGIISENMKEADGMVSIFKWQPNPNLFIHIFDEADEEWLHFLGKLQNVKALSLIKNSDFSIFFRKKNLVTTAGFPTKLSESIACGTPVITNDSSDLKEYIENGKNGFLVEIDDMDYLFEQILVICNLSKSQLFGMKEYCAQEKTFDYREYIEKIRVLFPK